MRATIPGVVPFWVREEAPLGDNGIEIGYHGSLFSIKLTDRQLQ